MCGLIGRWSSAYVHDSGRVIVDRTVQVAMNATKPVMQCLDLMKLPRCVRLDAVSTRQDA
jgi:hypothetical protein